MNSSNNNNIKKPRVLNENYRLVFTHDDGVTLYFIYLHELRPHAFTNKEHFDLLNLDAEKSFGVNKNPKVFIEICTKWGSKYFSLWFKTSLTFVDQPRN